MKLKTMSLYVLLTGAFMLGCPFVTAAQESSGFDPSQHMEVSELKAGMRGYGLTVFTGTKIERFDVVVVSVMYNFQAKRDVILVMCDDNRFAIAKGVKGVSGSPVFFEGKMAGAMSHGWTFGEEPLYVVTPIREMLDVRPTGLRSKANQIDKEQNVRVLERKAYENLMRPQLLSRKELRRIAEVSGLARKDRSSESSHLGGLSSESMAIALNGLNATALRILNKNIGDLVFEVGLAGSGSGQWGEGEKPKLERGATLTIPLMMGDVNGAALGTVTEVIGNDVYAFGHSWNATGGARWPMATGRIHTFVNRKEFSFKLGDPVEVVGTIWADETAAIYGQVGDRIEMIPVDVTIRWIDLEQEKHFYTQIADEQRLSPILATVATLNSAAYRGELPMEHTVRYESKIEFDGAESIIFSNMSSGMDLSDLLFDTLDPIAMILFNPWEKVRLKKLTVSVSLENKDRLYEVVSIDLPKRIFQPGEVIRAHAVLEPLRESRVSCTVELKIPESVEDGKYEIAIGSYTNYQQALRKSEPHLVRAFTVEDVQRILQKRMSIARNGLYLTMALPKRGVAIEKQAFPTLPASKAMLLTDKSRQGTTSKFGELLWAHQETDYVVAGKKTFDIQVRREP